MYDNNRSPVCGDSRDSLHKIPTMVKLKEEVNKRKRPDDKTKERRQTEKEKGN
jgi:hypothetical protein